MNFIKKHELPFELLSDKERKVHELYDVLKPKKMYGKEVIGTVRSTFIIDQDGILVNEFRNVKPKGHAEDVLKHIQEN